MCRKFIFWFSFVLVLGLVGNVSAQVYNQDIGGPSLAGSASYDEPNDTWTVIAGGTDIWGNADQLHMVYRPMEGDGIITANLASMTMDPLHDWCKAGVMIRETTEAGSKHASLLITGTNGAQYAYRSSTNGGSAAVGTWALQVPPKELTIERVGNTFNIKYWHVEIPGLFEYWQEASVDIDMKADVIIGLAVTSHNTGVPITALYDSVVWPAGTYEKAWEMRPLDGTSDLGLQPTLTWMPGDSATSHDVYLGTDPGALELVAAGKALGDESYTPDTPLETATTYYWQIVEQPLGVESPVLSFSTYVPPAGIERCVWQNQTAGIDTLVNQADGEVTIGSPTWCDNVLTTFNTPAGTLGLDNYLGRMEGLLWPETSGDYTFWIAGDDDVQLWMSSDENPDNLTRIAYHYGWNNSYNWYDTPEQQSAPITLVGGQTYWLRAFWKEGGGGDHCAVAWQGPDQPDAPVQSQPGGIITGYYFTPSTLLPYNPFPGDEVYTPLEVQSLNWTVDSAATRTLTSQEVYLGEDGGSMALIATPPVGQTSVAISPLALGKTYNWQVILTYGSEVVEGPVWSFSVQEWISMDIGRANPDPAGSSSYDPITDEYTINAGGDELWGNSDEFHYLFTTMEMVHDKGEIKARVLGVTHLADWTRASVQIRESRAANSRAVVMSYTPAQRAVFQARENTGGGWWDSYIGNEGLPVPQWVRITRDGNRFDGYYSSDGENWIHRNTAYVNMEPGKYVCIGLSQCHHNSADQSLLSTGRFDNLSIWTPDPRQSWNPTPGDGQEGVSLYQTLSWGLGEGAVMQMLYFSDNYEDVLYGLVEPVILPGDTDEYAVGPLDLTKPYYWAVDTMVQEGREMPLILGDIWNFRVEDYRLIEDFESYDPIPEPLPEQVVVEDGYIIPGYTIPAIEPDSACLLAEYLFEGDFNDTSGSGFDGTPIGDANIVNDAERGNVLSLDGDLDYVNCGNPAALNFATDNWSLSAWVKNTMTGTSDADKGSIVANGGDTGGGHRYCLIVSEQEDGEVTLVVDDDVTKVQARGDITKVNDDVWHHVVGVRDGDSIRIYIDGVEEGSGGLPAGYDLSGTVQHDVLIGAITDAPDPNAIYKDYAGLIDDVRIYNCVMTEENIRWLAELGDLVVPDVCVPPVYGPLLAEYLVELPDPTADTSGNNLHGTPLGDVTVVDDAVRGYVATFDGSGDAVNIGNNSRFNPEYGDFSISTWINMSSYGGNWGNVIIGKRGEGGLGWQLRRLSDTQRISFTTRNCGDQDGWGPGGQNVSLNEWHHVAAVRQGLQKWLYIDGVQEALSDICDYVTPCDHDVYIGARANGDNTGPEAYFNGMIDNMRYYKDYALSYGEVLNLMEYTPTTLMSDTWTTQAGSITLDYYEAHWGDQSMEFSYGGYGQTKRIPPFTDWHAGQGKAVALWFKGDPGNTPGEMCMHLPGLGDACYDGAPEDLMNPDWQEWNIALDAFDGDEVIKADDAMYITIDSSGGTTKFDDIRLYPSRCRAEFGPTTDLTGDCLVDTKDLRILIGDYLEGDYTLYAVDPGASGLVSHHEFEGDLTDSSGNGRDGTIVGDPCNIVIETDPEMGMVLSLPGGSNQYVSIPEVGISGNDITTIACWAKADHTNIPDWTLVFGFTGTATGEGGCGSHFNIGSIGGPGGMGAHAWCWEETIFSDDEALEWRHYTMTYDGTRIDYFGDGFWKDTDLGKSNVIDLSIRADRVHIGSRITQDSSFPGKVDDARIYNRVLSDVEIMYLAGVDEKYFPLDSVANFYDEEPVNSKKVNLKDYATMMEEWLYQQLWP